MQGGQYSYVIVHGGPTSIYLQDLLPDDWSALISRQASTCRSLPDAGSRATSRQASTCDLLPERSRMIHRSSFSHPPTQLNGRGTTSSEVEATGGGRRAGDEAGQSGARFSGGALLAAFLCWRRPRLGGRASAQRRSDVRRGEARRDPELHLQRWVRRPC